MAAIPASLPSTPSASMLGAHEPGITCPYHSRLGRCIGPRSDVREPWLALASPWASPSVKSLKRSTRPIVIATASAAPFFPLAGPKDLDDLPGAVVADQQTPIRRDGNGQRMREPGGKIADLAMLARPRP